MRRDLTEIVGADGFLTLLLSNLVIFASAGLSWMWNVKRVHRLARNASTEASASSLAIVLGNRLKTNGVGNEYARRLERARSLLAKGRTHHVLIVGGQTGGGDATEAAAGRRFLIGRGVPADALIVEELSRHTLENLRHARGSLHIGRAPFILVTSRYHLARSVALAEGLGMRPVPCAAEECLKYDALTLMRLVQEAYFLHWYYVGKTWSRWTGSSKSLARIS